MELTNEQKDLIALIAERMQPFWKKYGITQTEQETNRQLLAYATHHPESFKHSEYARYSGTIFEGTMLQIRNTVMALDAGRGQVMKAFIDLARRVAHLNPNAGEIGAGMLRQLVTDAQNALDGLAAAPAPDAGKDYTQANCGCAPNEACDICQGRAAPDAQAPVVDKALHEILVGRFVIEKCNEAKARGSDAVSVNCCNIDALAFKAAPDAQAPEEPNEEILSAIMGQSWETLGNHMREQARARYAKLRGLMGGAAQAPVVGDGLRERLQKWCVEHDLYWRAPDAHGVDCNLEQAHELLRMALAVEVKIEAAPDATVKAGEDRQRSMAAPVVWPERDTNKPAEQQGIFRKFIVQRVDGSDQPGGKHHGCRYFVLDLDHDQHAPAAMRAYGADCATTHPQLSAEIAERFGTPPTDAQSVRDAARYRALRDLSEGVEVSMEHNGNIGSTPCIKGADLDECADSLIEYAAMREARNA